MLVKNNKSQTLNILIIEIDPWLDIDAADRIFRAYVNYTNFFRQLNTTFEKLRKAEVLVGRDSNDKK